MRFLLQTGRRILHELCLAAGWPGLPFGAMIVLFY
jgi:hypothetical protein